MVTNVMQRRKQAPSGVIPTPPWFARPLVRCTLTPLLLPIPLMQNGCMRILDPAVGYGALLVEAAMYVHEVYQQELAMHTIVGQWLRGVDIDEAAVQTTRVQGIFHWWMFNKKNSLLERLCVTFVPPTRGLQ